MRLYDPSLGKITIDGIDIKDIPQDELRNNIGVVFQETYLFSGSVFDNIAYARPDATLDEVIAAAKAANVHEFVTKLPDGYNTVIGENGHSLSGGERQRVSIARAILKNPKILILDDSTSAVDTATDGKIREGMKNLLPDTTKIIIAQRINSVQYADRIIVIDDGQINDIGSHEELLSRNEIYKEVYISQQEGKMEQ
jgi:ATP-binding cassette subfamily B protein